MSEVTCVYCGKIFLAERPARAKYCSRLCTSRANPQRGRETYSRAYYQAHKQERQDRILRFQAMLNEIKLSSGCVDCGYAVHPAALDFDHVEGVKSKNISQMYTFSRKTILTEISKCVVRCANCHRIRHYELQPKRAGGAETPPADG